MKIYRGERLKSGLLVAVKDLDYTTLLNFNHLLDHIHVHSEGFEWGYMGSGPADLALSILADHLGEDEANIQEYAKHGGFYGPPCEECEGLGYTMEPMEDRLFDILDGEVLTDIHECRDCTFCEGLGFVRCKPSLAWKLHQRFKEAFVAGFAHDSWTLTATEIAGFVQLMLAQEPALKDQASK